MFPLGDVFGAVALSLVVAVGVWNSAVLGAERGRPHRLPVPGEPAAHAGRRAQRGARPDPDRLGRLPQGTRRSSRSRSRWSSPTGRAAGGSRSAVDSEGSRSPTARAPRCSTPSMSTSPPAPRWRWSARPARARPPSSSSSAASPTPPPGARAAGEASTTVSGTARRRSIRMVPQDGFLFDTTLAENLRVGRLGTPPPTASSPPRWTASGSGAWVDGLPAGLDTPVGERGSALSVGERQLVALIQAQLADPGLLVLDEATSAIDPETEQALAGAWPAVGQRPHHGERGPPALHRRAGRHRPRVRPGPPRRARPARSWSMPEAPTPRLHQSWLGTTRTEARSSEVAAS